MAVRDFCYVRFRRRQADKKSRRNPRMSGGPAKKSARSGSFALLRLHAYETKNAVLTASFEDGGES